MKLSKGPFNVKLYFIRRVSREIRCCQNECRVFTELKVITEIPFLQKKQLFLEYLLSGDQTVDLRSNLSISASERALKEPSNALLRGAVALLVPELCADL